ncbi:MAG: hypothetical protein M0Z41_11810 [Peptococcaceae bacterium]|nr:hypothetical protein [Peptococcaceae bacterium]
MGGIRISGEHEVGPDEKIAQLKARIEDLQRRMPAHTPRASMIRELEELEEELERLLGS